MPFNFKNYLPPTDNESDDEVLTVKTGAPGRTRWEPVPLPTNLVVDFSDYVVADGITDDTDGFEAACNAMLKNSSLDPRTNVRTTRAMGLMPTGTIRLTREINIVSVIGFLLYGKGKQQTFLLPDFAGRSMFRLNGFNRSRIGGFTVLGSAAQSLDYVILLGSDTTESATTSRIPGGENFEVAAAVKWKTACLQIGFPGSGLDVSSSKWFDIDCEGFWDGSSTTDYQHAIRVGSGIVGNNTQHEFYACEAIGGRYGLTCWSSNLGWFGGMIQSNGTDLYIDGPISGAVTVKYVRSEKSQRLLDYSGATSALSNISIEDYDFNAFDGFVAPDGEIIRIKHPGCVNLRNVVSRDSSTTAPIKVVTATTKRVTLNVDGGGSHTRTEQEFFSGLTSLATLNLRGWSGKATAGVVDDNEHVSNTLHRARLVTNTGTAYTATKQDDGREIEFTSPTPVVVTIPASATTNFSIGATLKFRQASSGQVSVVGATGVIIDAPTGARTNVFMGTITLVKRGTDRWLAIGNTQEAAYGYAQVQKGAATSNATGTVTVNLSTTPVNGNRLIAVFESVQLNNSAQMFAPAGWTLLTETAATSDQPRVQIWTKIAGASEPTAVTFTVTNTNTFLTLNVLEYSGLAGTPGSYAAANSGSSNVTNLTVGPTPATPAGEALALAVVANFAGVTYSNTWTGGFAQQTNTGRISAATRRLASSSTPSTNESWTVSVTKAAGLIAVFPVA